MRGKQELRLVIMVSLLAFCTQLLATANKNRNETDWCQAKKSKNISLFYRWVKFEGHETREMKAKFVIEVKIPKIPEQFSLTENYFKWAAGIKECGIEKFNESLWSSHTVIIISSH